MSAGQCKAARRRNMLRYGRGKQLRNIHEAIAEERRKAARQASVVKKKK